MTLMHYLAYGFFSFQFAFFGSYLIVLLKWKADKNRIKVEKIKQNLKPLLNR